MKIAGNWKCLKCESNNRLVIENNEYIYKIGDIVDKFLTICVNCKNVNELKVSGMAKGLAVGSPLQILLKHTDSYINDDYTF